MKKDHISHLDYEDIMDFDIYQQVWIPVGDEKETDIIRLINQGRINRF